MGVCSSDESRKGKGKPVVKDNSPVKPKAQEAQASPVKPKAEEAQASPVKPKVEEAQANGTTETLTFDFSDSEAKKPVEAAKAAPKAAAAAKPAAAKPTAKAAAPTAATTTAAAPAKQNGAKAAKAKTETKAPPAEATAEAKASDKKAVPAAASSSSSPAKKSPPSKKGKPARLDTNEDKEKKPFKFNANAASFTPLDSSAATIDFNKEEKKEDQFLKTPKKEKSPNSTSSLSPQAKTFAPNFEVTTKSSPRFVSPSVTPAASPLGQGGSQWASAPCAAGVWARACTSIAACNLEELDNLPPKDDELPAQEGSQVIETHHLGDGVLFGSKLDTSAVLKELDGVWAPDEGDSLLLLLDNRRDQDRWLNGSSLAAILVNCLMLTESKFIRLKKGIVKQTTDLSEVAAVSSESNGLPSRYNAICLTAANNPLLEFPVWRIYTCKFLAQLIANTLHGSSEENSIKDQLQRLEDGGANKSNTTSESCGEWLHGKVRIKITSLNGCESIKDPYLVVSAGASRLFVTDTVKAATVDESGASSGSRSFDFEAHAPVCHQAESLDVALKTNRWEGAVTVATAKISAHEFYELLATGKPEKPHETQEGANGQSTALVCGGGVGAVGPAWTRGEIEPPNGSKDMGTWKASVYTQEQQERLGVDEAGVPASPTTKTKTSSTPSSTPSPKSGRKPGRMLRMESIKMKEEEQEEEKTKDKAEFEKVARLTKHGKALVRQRVILNFVDNNIQGDVDIEMDYEPITHAGKKNYQMPIEVPKVYFPMRGADKVKLFRDAESSAPVDDKQTTSDGKPYEEEGCWSTMFDSINGAKNFIYLTGWSLNEHTTMKRGGDQLTVRELLIQKAEEGVQVVIMLWDEPVSAVDLNDINARQAWDAFEGTKVHCVKVPRSSDHITKHIPDRAYVQSQFFTHHQKTLIVDAEPSRSGPRKLLAFLGGFDLLEGRWDTPEHPLWRVGKGDDSRWPQSDFVAPQLKDGSATYVTGPRMPWHDVHCQLEGSPARDVLQNFLERWAKQGKKGVQLLNSHKICNFSDPLNSKNRGKNNKNKRKKSVNWGVQLFRSIDSNSANFRKSRVLSHREGYSLDCSVQRAYIHHIRRAKKFIYIENEFFIGGSHLWESPMRECDNLIPVEIARKVISKVQKREEFAVYIVIPMYPQGVPSSGEVQQQLFWQSQTMLMMNKLINKEIKEQGIEGKDAGDYLNFFCLANREPKERKALLHFEFEAASNTCAGLLAKTRRFPVYVHSKLMVVDDEVVMIGSANVNNRSLEGGRDTEIAMAASQLTNARGAPARGKNRGDVHCFRMRLFQSHLGQTNKGFANPQNAACVSAVKELAASNWKAYKQDKPVDLPAGHLLPYPLQFSEKGVEPLESSFCFPDTQAPVMGHRSIVIPTFMNN